MKFLFALIATLTITPMIAGAAPAKKTLNCNIQSRNNGAAEPDQTVSKIVETEGSDDSAFLIAEHETTALNGTVKISISGFQGQKGTVQPFDSVVVRLEDTETGVIMISSGRGFLSPKGPQDINSAFVNYNVQDPNDKRMIAREVLVECTLD